MQRGTEAPSHAPVDVPGWVVVADLVAKALLVVLVVGIALDPTWGNLEGKAPGTRAVVYPMLAAVVPVLHAVRVHRGHRGPYPWVADLLLTVIGFSDLLGNRLDLYDEVTWFDDAVHFADSALLAAAVLLLSGTDGAALGRRLEVAVASAMTASLAWELWEYYAFVTRSKEATTAYADMVGDMVLGWCGAVTAAVVVGLVEREHARAAAPPALPALPVLPRGVLLPATPTAPGASHGGPR